MSSDQRNYVIESHGSDEADRVAFSVAHMTENLAYRAAAEAAGGDADGVLLEGFRERYRAYRQGWRAHPARDIEQAVHGEAFRRQGRPPLCIDIETAAFCDLACPFCFRQSIATPDKLMPTDLYQRLIDEAAALGVPSVKLNWRGEPLAHPRLPELVDYAKRRGILEVLINTNAVELTERKSRELIEAGLDVLIYSFDGGTKETYEKMRVGRFRENRFEPVYANIERFAALRSELGSVFPRTRIQMILTAETYGERDAFFGLFGHCVDDASVKAYTERGGDVKDVDPDGLRRIEAAVAEHGIEAEQPQYWRSLDGELHLAVGRLPCEQPFQRLMVSYDGRVSMCCYDWGIEHPIGYVDEAAWAKGDREYELVLERAQSGARGFELMQLDAVPARYVQPEQKVQTLEEIWFGPLVDDVRRKHIERRIDEIPVCAKCTFKETYEWIRI